MTQIPPKCFECFDKSTRPCAPGGRFDPSFIALSYLEYIALSEHDIDRAEPLFWAFNCLSDMLIDAPELAFDITLLMIDALTTRLAASVIAAGPLEDLIADTGEIFIDRIEAHARRSPRFRFVLSGVWPQGNENSPLWARILQARAPGPNLDAGDPLPPPD